MIIAENRRNGGHHRPVRLRQDDSAADPRRRCDGECIACGTGICYGKDSAKILSVSKFMIYYNQRGDSCAWRKKQFEGCCYVLSLLL